MLSQSSIEILRNVHPDLVKLVNEVIKFMPMRVLCGHRNQVDQDEAYKTGHSKLAWPHSKHNSLPSRAIDMCPEPYDPQNKMKIIYASGIVMGSAQKLGISLRWGGDFSMNFDPSDEKFQDLFHFELVP